MTSGFWREATRSVRHAVIHLISFNSLLTLLLGPNFCLLDDVEEVNFLMKR